MKAIICCGLTSTLHCSLNSLRWLMSVHSGNSRFTTAELLSHVLYKNEGKKKEEEEKKMNTSLSFLLFLNSVNSANLVRKSLVTTKAWQLLIAVLLYNKKIVKWLKRWKLGWRSCSPVVSDWMFRMECLLTPWAQLLCWVNTVFPSVVYHLACLSKTNHPVCPASPGHPLCNG